MFTAANEDRKSDVNRRSHPAVRYGAADSG